MLEIGLRDVRLFNFVINISPCVHVKFNIRGEIDIIAFLNGLYTNILIFLSVSFLGQIGILVYKIHTTYLIYFLKTTPVDRNYKTNRFLST